MLPVFHSLILAATALAMRTVAENLEALPLASRQDSRTRILTAISLQSELQRREVDFTLKHTCEHHYVDHMLLMRGDNARFAKTTMHFKLGMLALEDIESELGQIECSRSAIELEFLDEDILRKAKRYWDNFAEFVVVSSHLGCNLDGERAPYMVSNITYKQDMKTAILLITRMEWKEAYTFTRIDFGMTGTSSSSEYSISGLRSHDNLHRNGHIRRRQAAASSTMAFPLPPKSTPSSDLSRQNLNFSTPNQTLLSTDQFAIRCKNCTLVGEIEITHGTFNVNSLTSNVFKEAIHFIEHGFFNVVANGVNAHVELDTSVSLLASQPFAQEIWTLALPGFQIPGIATVGPQFSGSLEGKIDISHPIDFIYGFDLTVPDKSSINLNIGNLTNSSSHGFSNSTVIALPFNTSTKDVTASFSFGLRAEVLLGVSLLSGTGNIHAGVFLDIPSVSVSVSSLSNVNANCEPLAYSDSVNGLPPHSYSNLTNIVPSVAVGIGLDAGATMTIPDITTIAIEASTTLTGTNFALETVCLSWNSKATAFVSPSFSPTTALTAAAATGAGAGSGNGGGFLVSSSTPLRDQNPLAGLTGLVWATGLALCCTLSFFARL